MPVLLQREPRILDEAHLGVGAQRSRRVCEESDRCERNNVLGRTRYARGLDTMLRDAIFLKDAAFGRYLAGDRDTQRASAVGVDESSLKAWVRSIEVRVCKAD